MTKAADLKIGSFYWVLPVNDPDTDQDWENEEQPARFAGPDEAGRLRWNCLNIDSTSGVWPMKWIGPEIVKP